MPSKRMTTRLQRTAGVAMLAMIVAAAPAATWDSDSTTDDNWSTGANWTGDTAPGAGDPAVFDATAEGGTAGDFASVTGFSVVDASTTVQQLLFGSTGAGTTTHDLTINAGVTLQVDGDGDGSYDAADFTVGQDLSATYTGTNTAEVTVAGDGTLRIGAAATHTADIVIGRRPNSNAISDGDVQANLDLSGLASFEANVDEFTAGHDGWNSSSASFNIALAADNTINANTLNLGDTHNAGGTNGNDFLLGQTNVFNADTIYIGHGKTGVDFEFNTGLTSPTLTINDTSGAGAADLFIAYNDHNTGTAPTTTADTSGGTLNATLDEVVIGLHDAGSGNASGTFIMGAGSVTANSVVLANPGASGTSTNPQNTQGTLRMTADGSSFDVSGSVTDGGGSSALQIDEGDMTVGGSLSVDDLRVGFNGSADNATASLTVNGTSASVGSAADPGTLHVGHRTADIGTSSGAPFTGTLDLSAVSTFTANLTVFEIGTATSSSGGGQRFPVGDVMLAADSNITADSITVAHSPAVGLGGSTSYLRLGAATVINADTITIGGSKGHGRLEFLAAGSTVTINGKAGAGTRADLLVGNQPVGTGGGSTGVVDGSSSTINAELDNLTIGRKHQDAGGGTAGVFTFSAGLIDANTISLGERLTSASNGTVKGTFNFNGGTLRAGTIQPGAFNGADPADEADFNWTGGTLHVDNFAMTLDQDGGILAPGQSPGMSLVAGDYNQANTNGATYEVELNGYDQGDQTLADGVGYDFVDVSGDAVLDGILKAVLLDGFQPVEGDTFDVLTAASITLGSNFTLDQSMAPVAVGYIETRLVSGGNGQILQLLVIPLPGAGVMGLAMMGLLTLKRPRRV